MNDRPVPRALVAGAKAMNEMRSAAKEARADAETFAELVHVLHAEVLDARALIEAGRGSEARANLDRIIEGLDGLIVAPNSDKSEP